MTHPILALAADSVSYWPLGILAISVGFIVFTIIKLKLHPFLALIFAAVLTGLLTGDLPGMTTENVGLFKSRVTLNDTPGDAANDMLLAVKWSLLGFGNTAAAIGFVVALAAIIGTCMLGSGAADRVVRWLLGIFGEKRAGLVLLMSGFLLSIPVFFDTVFFLLIPLARALSLRTGKSYTLYVIAMAGAGAITHSMVPPTPGPLFVAVQLDVDLGLMIMMGLVVGSVACATGYVYAKFVNGHDKWRVPLRDSADLPLAKLEEIAQRDNKSLPPLGLSLLPVLLPIVLIAGNTILQKLIADPPVGLANFLGLVGDKNIALIISAAVALGLLAMQKRGDKQALFDSVQSALASGGVVILITAAGASFGAMLQQTNIAARIGGLAADFEITGLLVLPLAFFVTAVVRTAQGSATVSMITSVGIFAGMAATLPFHPVYLAMAIGCGSKPFPWMNDSGFWVINRMSGMTIGETIRSVSFLMTVMAIDGLVAVMLLAWLFPMSG